VEVLQLAVALTEKWRLTQQARVTIADLEKMVQARSRELEATMEQLRGSLVERDRTEAALRTSEDKFSRAFRLHPDALSIHRVADGACVELNSGFTKITGYAAEEMPRDGALFRDWALWVDAKVRARLHLGLREQGEVSGVEGLLRRKDGSLIRCLISARIVEIGGEACVLAIMRDLTVQKRLEEQLAQSQKMEAVGQLAGGIAHDYNNVLTATLMQLELLIERTDLAPVTREALKELERMANRSAVLTRQLLAFSRRQVMQKSPMELNDALRNLFKMLRRLLGENIALDFQFAEAAMLVDADIGMIEQLVTNICLNARDAMQPRGGRLTVRTRIVVLDELPPDAPPEACPGRFVTLSIADTGCGMEAATLARIFEPFFTTKEIGKGTGLGLATVHGIAQQHCGWVEVESALGVGSLFRIVFPALSESAVVTVAAITPAIKYGHETILLVEDEDAVRLMMAVALRRCGYQVHEASNGKQAMQEWNERLSEIDLLLSDMVMPNGMSGLELVEHFRRAKPDLRVILTSGYSAELIKLEAPNGRGMEYLAKPFKIGTLTDLVRKCLDAASPNLADPPFRATLRVGLDI
jgi:PAS domain S-box-containing protein